MQNKISHNNANTRPYELTHLLPTKDKDIVYVKGLTDYYIRQSNIASSSRSTLQILYDAAQGILDKDDYRYMLNPMATKNEKYQKFPAKLRNYDIIKPIVNSYLEESSRRRNTPEVIVANADAQDKRKDALNDKMSRIIAQDFVNNLNAMGIDTGVPTRETQGYKEAKQEFEENYDDKRARFGQQALDYLYHNLDLDEKIRQLKYDWLVAGRVATYKETRYNDIKYYVEDPRDITVIGWGESPYAEDAEAVVSAKLVTSSEILSRFYEEIAEREDKQEILEYLDVSMFKDVAFSEFTDLRIDNINNRKTNSDENDSIKTGKLTLYHVTWNTFTDVQILHYYDEFGAERSMYVDDTYKLDKANGDIRLEKFTIREWYECFRLDDKFYFDAGRGRVQRHMVNNLASCKLPYNMALFGYRQTEPDSIVKQMMTYQMLYNIFHYRWELLLAQNKGKISLLPVGLIPNGDDWDEDKFFYFMEALRMMFYDETAPNAQQFIQGIKAIDMELAKSMDVMWRNMMAIKQEAWDLVGMNRQRYGLTNSSDGKGVNQQALAQSSMITGAWNFQFDKFLEKEYRGLLDFSKVAFASGKKGSYVNSQGKQAFFELQGDDIEQYMESEFNVFARNSVFEQEKHEKAENLILTMGQNGLGADGMLDILDASSFQRMKHLVKKGVAAEKAFQESLKRIEQETAQATAQADIAKQDSKNKTDIEVAKIQAQAKLNSASSPNELIDGLMEDTSNQIQDVDGAKLVSQISNEQAAIRNANAKAEDHQIKREGFANNLAVAKENKNRHDK